MNHDRSGPPLRTSTAAHAAALGGGAALGLAFPTADQGWIAWVALVPLVVAVDGRGAVAAAGLGVSFAVASGLAIFGWLFAVPGLTIAQFAVLTAYHALYPAAWCIALVMLRGTRLPLVVTAPAAWVALETLRAHAGFVALPWGTLAQSQHRDLPLLQLAAWGGEGAVSFVVAAANVALASALVATPHRRRTAVATSVVVVFVAGTSHGLGALAIGDTPSPTATVTVAAVQPRIGLHERDTVVGRAAIWRRLVAATAAADAAGADLVAWPETAIGDPRHDADLAARLVALSAATRASLIVGAAETEKVERPSATGVSLDSRPRYNSAYLVTDGALLGEPYRKRRLLPFAEYLPLRGVVAWPAWLVPDLVDGTPGVDAPPRVFDAAAPERRVGLLICWENVFAALSRDAVGDGARLLVHLTNDAWFGDSRAAAQHDAISVLRAVENAVPVVTVSNTGPSQIVDAHGRVLARLDPHAVADVVAAAVPIGRAGSFYTRHGDLFAAACAAVAAIALMDALLVDAWRRRAIDRFTLSGVGR